MLSGDGAKDYLGGAEFTGEPEAYYHADGRVMLKNKPLHQYHIKDHLGNLAVLFQDADQDGLIDPNSDLEVPQRHFYYPFGMEFGGMGPYGIGVVDPYKYNGKEWSEVLGLGWYFYGFRMHDPAIGRFTGVDPIAEKFPHVTTYNYAENEPVSGIDLHGLQYVNFNESFYSISMGQTWVHTGSVHSGRDAYGIPYTGTSVPIQQIRIEGPEKPEYSGSFARSLQWQGENLGRMYERGGSFRAYSKGANNAALQGKIGLAFTLADLTVSAYTSVSGYSDAIKADEQLIAIQSSWEDVLQGVSSGLIDPRFQNLQDLSSIANFVYQGADNFGDNDDLRANAINVTKHISGNYKGEDKTVKPDSGLDNYKPSPILVRPPTQENGKN